MPSIGTKAVGSIAVTPFGAPLNQQHVPPAVQSPTAKEAIQLFPVQIWKCLKKGP